MQPKAGLDPKQFQAVKQIEGPVLVVAGAGSGKTRIVTFRIAHLLELGVPASEILAVTFTNKAAEEMKRRIEKLANKQILACTYHSLCARILREDIAALGFRKDFLIYDEDDSEKVIKECLKERQLDEKNILKSIQIAISQAKNNLIEPQELAKDNPVAAGIYQTYQHKLKQYNAIDFDDMLFLSVKLFMDHPKILEKFQERWRFVLVDEYQDTNKAQSYLTKLLVAKHHNIFAVGDPDQSIYSWRGANIQNILRFQDDFPGAEVITLDQNYRSNMTILSAANALIAQNSSRFEKKLWSELGEGEKIQVFRCENEHAEADFVIRKILELKKSISLDEIAIFYRTNFQSRVFEDYLLKKQIPYIIVGGVSFYQRKEIKDVLAFLRIALSDTDMLSLRRTINLPKRGIGDASLEKLEKLAQQSHLTIFSCIEKVAKNEIGEGFSAKQKQALLSYCEIILQVRGLLEKQIPLEEIVTEVISKTGYDKYLQEDKETFEERRENIAELISKAHDWEEENHSHSLPHFLEELSLKSSSDTENSYLPSVKLMTLHNSKGLEFPAVFLVGMEEELFPHMNAKGSESEIEEERRLCYVGITRAKEYLYLTSCRTRFLWGTPRIMNPSRFLSEIPAEYVKLLHAEGSYSSDREFSSGDIVKHRDFGVGIVQKRYQTSLGLTYDVFFPEDDTERTLVAKYAKLAPSN